MIPLQPFSSLIRTKQFVTEEWETYFADNAVNPASNVTGGWRGLLYANLALIDPQASFDFFTSSRFDPSYLDGGASQTWYLAFAAGKHFLDPLGSSYVVLTLFQQWEVCDRIRFAFPGLTMGTPLY